VINKKIAKEFWDSKPISPPSEPPDATEIIKRNLSSAVHLNLREFFEDFERFVHVSNHGFAELDNFPFRLKDLPDTEDDRTPIRRFQIFYNQTAVGELDISPSFYDRTNYRTNIDFRISRPRWIKYGILVEFIHIVGHSVAGSDAF
jgi:hypothetical protein